MHHAIPIQTRLHLIALRAGLRWADVAELTFREFAALVARKAVKP